jgi:WD40 repeat protein
MSCRLLTTILAGLLLTITTDARAEPGDELIGEWERTIGARKTREVWKIDRDGGKKLRLTGRFLQADKEVGKFHGDGEKYDEASGTLRFKLNIDLAGQPAKKDEAEYEITFKGARLSVTSKLGTKKETLALTKAKATAETTASSTSTPAASAGEPAASSGDKRNLDPAALPAFAEVRRIQLGSTGYLFQVALSPDGKLLALSDNGQEGKAVAILDVDTGMLVKRLAGGGLVGHMAFTDDGATFISAAFNLDKPSPVIAWDTATWSEKWQFDNGRMTGHATSGDGKWYAANKGNVPGGPDGVLKIWDLATQAEVHSQACSDGGRMAWPADGRVLLFGRSTPGILERQTKKLIGKESGRGGDNGVEGEISAFAVTADGRGYALGDVHGSSSVLVTSSGKLVKSLPRLNQGVGRIGDLAFIDNRTLLVAHRASEFALFDVISGKALAFTRDKNAGKRTTSDIDHHPNCPRFAAHCGSEVVVYELPK